MAELQNWNIGGNFLSGYEKGRERARGERFNALAGQALAAPEAEREALVAQAVGLDPTAGFALQGKLEADTDRRRTQLFNLARGFKQIHGQNPQAAGVFYTRQIAPGLRRLGFDVSDQYNEAEVLPVVDQVLAAYDPTTAQGAPTGIRETQAIAREAGIDPGSEEYKRLFRVQGGLDPRAVTGAPRQITVKGADGRERQGYFDPTTSQTFVFDERANGFRPLGGGESVSAPVAPAPQAAPGPQRVGMTRVNLEGFDPTVAQRIGTVAESMRQAGFPNDQIDAWVNQQIGAANTAAQSTTAPAPAAAPSSLGVGRSPEEQAYLTEQAQERARLEAYDRATSSEVDRAARTEFAKETAKAQAALQSVQGKKAVQANDVLSLLDAAEPLIVRSTGSGLGAARDAAAGYFGRSTEGADAIAALRPIAAALIGNVPRMEGPQSDADRRLYEQAAGDVANASTPVSQRLSAIQTMRNLQQKYARLNQSGGDTAPSNAAQPGGWGIRRVK